MNKTFPFLDVEFFWSKREVLRTRVYLKPNQHLKYLNSDSEHTNACIKAIPKGVLQRLTKLTSLNADNHDKTINTLYPEHANALRQAGIAPSRFSTLSTSLESLKQASSLSKRYGLRPGEMIAEARL